MYGAPENNKTHTGYSNGMSPKCMELLKTIKFVTTELAITILFKVICRTFFLWSNWVILSVSTDSATGKYWSVWLHLLLIKTITSVLKVSTYKWPQICSTCRKHLPVLSSFMTYHWVCNSINTTGVTSVAGTAYPSGAPEFTQVFSGVHVTQSLVLYVCFVDRCLSFCTFSYGHCVVFFFNIQILITPLVSSNSSYH
jgi:hypothetical protein